MHFFSFIFEIEKCKHKPYTDYWSSLNYNFVFSVLQGIDDASCTGLKNLLLGAISKCLHNTKDAIQVHV